MSGLNQNCTQESKRNECLETSHSGSAALYGSSTYRTRVMAFFERLELSVFCWFRLKLCLHEFLLTQTHSPPRYLGSTGPDSGRNSDGLLRVGRYFRSREGSETRWLLLWMRALEDRRRMQQDVRVAEVCVAMVGGELREAADKTSVG